MIKAIIVDDEPLAREGVALRLAQHDDIQIIAECENGSDAIRANDAWIDNISTTA